MSSADVPRYLTVTVKNDAEIDLIVAQVKTELLGTNLLDEEEANLIAYKL